MGSKNPASVKPAARRTASALTNAVAGVLLATRSMAGAATDRGGIGWQRRFPTSLAETGQGRGGEFESG
jgi:hypothetical protein